MNSELRQRPEYKETGQGDTISSTTSFSEDMENEWVQSFK